MLPSTSQQHWSAQVVRKYSSTGGPLQKKYFCSDFFPNRRPPLSPLHFIEKFSKKRPLCSWWTVNVESRPIVQFFSSVATMVTPSPRLCTSSTEATELLLGGPLMEWQPSGNITEQIFAEYDSPWCCNG